MDKEVRLQKYLADCGVASRRKSEEIITGGKVKVNGNVITELGTKVIPGKDKVLVAGKEIQQVEQHIYIMLNKPEGYITTVHEQLNRPSVMDLVTDIKERIFPVGRLDMDTTGLIVMTNDGSFAYKITHPKHEINKKYIAEIKGCPDSLKLSKFSKGLKIEDYTTAPASIKLLAKKKYSSIVEIIIHEGKNRQVKKMCEAIGHPVIRLQRAALGGLELGNLPLGKWKYITKKDIEKIFLASK